MIILSKFGGISVKMIKWEVLFTVVPKERAELVLNLLSLFKLADPIGVRYYKSRKCKFGGDCKR